MDKYGPSATFGFPQSASTLWHQSEHALAHPYLGRPGGGNRATPDTSYPDKLRNIPDPPSFVTWAESFDLRGFMDGEVWRQAILEGWGTCLLVWLTGLAAYSLVPTVS